MKLFGTDGIRGIYGEKNMNEELAAKMGRALVSFCRKRDWPAKVVIARDTRESGPVLEKAVVSGIISAGGNAISAGVLPTPALAHLVGEFGAGMGLVISASHNPFHHNGLKPFKYGGTKFSDSEEKEIEKYILKAEAPEAVKYGAIELKDAKKKYVDFLSEKMQSFFGQSSIFPAVAPALPLLKSNFIVLDCANGATFEAAPDMFSRLAAGTDSICANPDGKNINDGCGSQHPEKLREKVLEKKADLGLAFDGDGDRVIAVDEKGRVLTGDQSMYVIAKFLKDKGLLKNDLVVTTVMSNLGFVAALKKIGIGHIATAVGDRPVFFEMQKSGAVLGGEESGHVIYSDIHPAGDGILGGMLILLAMKYFKKPLSILAGEVALFPKILVNVEVKSKPELGGIQEIQGIIKEAEKKLGGEGRVVVRYSGTENLCRVMVEGKDKGEVKEYAEKIAEVIKKKLS